VQRIKPNLIQRLKELFDGFKIELFAEEGCSTIRGYLLQFIFIFVFRIPLEALLCCVQASEDELQNKLLELPVIEIGCFSKFVFFNLILDGNLSWISDKFILKLLEKVNEVVDNNNDLITSFTREDLLTRISMENIPMQAIDWLLNSFCDKNGLLLMTEFY
jgi:hypothetical protein